MRNPHLSPRPVASKDDVGGARILVPWTARFADPPARRRAVLSDGGASVGSTTGTDERKVVTGTPVSAEDRKVDR
jgi:hypothetical protein